MSQTSQRRSELLESIRSAANQSKRGYLTYDEFKKLTGVPMSRLLRNFDSWTEACKQAGVTPGSTENIKPRFSKGKQHALDEVKRIARALGAKTLSKSQFDRSSPQVKACTVARLCGGWAKALKAASLDRHPSYREEIPLSDLANEFLATFNELGKIPTVHQLARRSAHGKNSFTRKFGGYKEFKKVTLENLLARSTLPEQTRKAFQDHLNELKGTDLEASATPPRPHSKGRTLGFRAFAYAPTYEAEVVSLFSSIADDLGFEIVSQRSAFPDCEARRIVNPRRKRYKKCLIEFEFRSSDYKQHKHPLKGCDLIVCWIHDWDDCPLEVLELSSRIPSLNGWK
jgi:hypothetical protein